MSSVGPHDASYAETFERLARLIQADEDEHGRIAEMSESSLREWLNEFAISAASILGVTAAKVAAMVADYVQIGRNAVDVAKKEFRRSYATAKRIRPVDE